MMRVCVCGWYFEAFDEFYQALHRIHAKHPVHVVANKPSEYLNTLDVPVTVRDNTGLEWGAYNHYLMHVWPEDGSVVFMHDDIRLHPFLKGDEIMPPEAIFNYLETHPADQAYIFQNRTADAENMSQHGRAWLGSQRFLAEARLQGGFWFDSANRGYTDPSRKEVRDQMGCDGYNDGIRHFHEQAEKIGGDVHRRLYMPALQLAVRGI